MRLLSLSPPATAPEWVMWLGKLWLLLVLLYQAIAFLIGGLALFSGDGETFVAGLLALTFSPFVTLLFGWPGLVLLTVGWLWKRLARFQNE